jgi:predicted metalloprotease
VRRLVTMVLAALVVAALSAPTALAAGGGNPSLDDKSGGSATPAPTADYRPTLKAAIADIQNFWSDEFPTLYGHRYARIPDSRIFAARPGIKLPRCQGQVLTYNDAKDNAFYCFKSNYVAYDDVGLFPRLNRDFGPFAVALVLAHEWGHAIQDRAGEADEPTLLKEQQADCFAGSWTKRVSDGDAPKVHLKGGNLDSALTAMLKFRDPVGSSAEEEGAHGSGFDRVNVFQEGFDGGAQACVNFFTDPPPVVEIPFTSKEDANAGGNLEADKVIPASVDLLNDFYTQVEPAYQPKDVKDIYSFDSSKPKDLPTCGGQKEDADTVRNRVFYCIDDGNFGFDEKYLQHVYDDIGDFGVTTLLANPFATYVETLQQFPGVNDNSDNAVLGADCYTGGFAAAMFNGVLLVDPSTNQPEYTLSPGDLDETIQAFIDYSQNRGVSKDLDVTFARLRAFRDGFLNGYGTCSSYRDSTQSLG